MQRQFNMDDDDKSAPQSNSSNGNSKDDGFYHWEEDMQINRTADESMPVISFNTIEENTIELLVVVTRKMHLILKGRLTEYLVATIGSVSH